MGENKKYRLTRRYLGGGLAIVTVAAGVTFGALQTTAVGQSNGQAGTSIAGTYSYNQTFSFGKYQETLKLYAGGTLAFASGCSGLWVRQGSTVAMSIDANCDGVPWAFMAQVTSTGLGTKKSPGVANDFYKGKRYLGTWYAVRQTTSAGAATGVRPVAGLPRQPRQPRQSSGTSVTGDYTYNDNEDDTGEPLAIKANGTVLFGSGCSGLWVRQGDTIALDITSNCFSETWVFVGTITKAGFNSKKSPGSLRVKGYGHPLGTWYAVRQ